MEAVISNNLRGGRGRQSRNAHKINREIRAAEVRLVGDDGHVYGVVSNDEARRIADDAGLDLVEMSPNAKPPVCKLIDYGKYKYQLQKKANEAKKKQATVSVKEIKIRPGIDSHDLGVKLKKVFQFLEQGDKVKMLMQFRGREMAHKQIGLERFHEVINGIMEATGATVESPAKMMGNRIIAILAPSKKK